MNKYLFSPIKIRSLELKNRIVLSPMCQYSASNGFTNAWHMVHLGKFSQGGFGLIFTEATSVIPEGRITHGDLGIWSNDHINGFAEICYFVHQNNCKMGVQLGHAGRKASMQRPWHGNGPLNQDDFDRGEKNWTISAPSALPLDENWLEPNEMSINDIEDLKSHWEAAFNRSVEAGFDVIEIHAAHGYLIHEFLSPLTNQRSDQYGGTFDNRIRLLNEIVEIARRTIPESMPLFVRISSTDGIENGWSIEDSVDLAKILKNLGVDVIDCSSGGLMGSATAAKIKRGPGFQVPLSDEIKSNSDIKTMAVGLITNAKFANSIVQEQKCDLVAIGREALFNPNWALHTEIELNEDSNFNNWPNQYGWWLDKRKTISNK